MNENLGSERKAKAKSQAVKLEGEDVVLLEEPF